MSLPVIAIAADHGGFELKSELSVFLTGKGFAVLDLGTNSADAVDYPDIAERLTQAILEGTANRGILICGTGIGIGIAANRVPGIRAATCPNPTMARLAREHNDANVLSLGARVIGPEVARDVVLTFLNTPFDGGERHRRRIEKLG
jgi:ribose 5-phosphate isomerase B